MLFWSQPIKVPGRFRGGSRTFPGNPGGSGSNSGGSGPAFWPCSGGSGIVREVPAMLLGVSVQVPVQCVFLKVLLKGVEFRILKLLLLLGNI